MIDIPIKEIKKLPKFKKIGRYLSSGCYGNVYQFGTRIIKISLSESFKKDLIILKKLKNHKHDCIAKLYDYGFIQINGYKYIWYISEKLNAIPLNQVNDFPEFGGYLSKKMINKYSKLKSEKFSKFFKKVKELPFAYNDFHNGNMMQTKDKKVKFIDLTSFVNKK